MNRINNRFCFNIFRSCRKHLSKIISTKKGAGVFLETNRKRKRILRLKKRIKGQLGTCHRRPLATSIPISSKITCRSSKTRITGRMFHTMGLKVFKRSLSKHQGTWPKKLLKPRKRNRKRSPKLWTPTTRKWKCRLTTFRTLSTMSQLSRMDHHPTNKPLRRKGHHRRQKSQVLLPNTISKRLNQSRTQKGR